MSRLHDAWVRVLADSLVFTHLFHILCWSFCNLPELHALSVALFL